MIALLGRRDEPTDALEEYCNYLGGALRTHDIQLEICRVPWNVTGWNDALQALRAKAVSWNGTWVLVQYTALAWSARGFPYRIFRVLKILRRVGARIAVVFHDVEPYHGTRLIDACRRAIQTLTMRRVARFAELAIFTVPTEKLSWTPRDVRAAFIPVGPNLPIPTELSISRNEIQVPAIGVFSITGGEPGARETGLIISAVRHAVDQVGPVRLSVFGRHAELREVELRRGLEGLPVDVSVEGVIEPSEVVTRLCSCDVLFFVRGGISSRRGSAIAGIACGLPLIAFSGSETAAPITDAGVILVSPNAPQELNSALVRVLRDPAYRFELASRSRDIYLAHFAWTVIAARYADLLRSLP